MLQELVFSIVVLNFLFILLKKVVHVRYVSGFKGVILFISNSIFKSLLLILLVFSFIL